MDRRKSLKTLLVGTVSTGVILDACNTSDKKVAENKPATTTGGGINRMKEEAAYEKELASTTFFISSRDII